MKQHITVFGSFVVDLMARAPHLPVPGETVKGSLFRMGPGGKGFNQGVAAKKAGADLTMVTKLGRDLFGGIALDTMKELGMDPSHLLYSDDTGTGSALIMVDEGTAQNEIVVTLGSCATITPGEVDGLEKLLRRSGYLLTQLEINPDATERAIRLAHRCGVPVLLNPAPVQPIPEEVLSLVEIITPNEVEAGILTGIEVAGPESAERAADWFISRGVGAAVLTLGGRGVFVKKGAESRLLPAHRVSVVDTTGAGDAFSGGLAAALAEGMDLFEAAAFANAVAALSVTRLGTTPSMPGREEIDRFLSSHPV